MFACLFALSLVQCFAAVPASVPMPRLPSDVAQIEASLFSRVNPHWHVVCQTVTWDKSRLAWWLVWTNLYLFAVVQIANFVDSDPPRARFRICPTTHCVCRKRRLSSWRPPSQTCSVAYKTPQRSPDGHVALVPKPLHTSSRTVD